MDPKEEFEDEEQSEDDDVLTPLVIERYRTAGTIAQGLHRAFLNIY